MILIHLPKFPKKKYGWIKYRNSQSEYPQDICNGKQTSTVLHANILPPPVMFTPPKKITLTPIFTMHDKAQFIALIKSASSIKQYTSTFIYWGSGDPIKQQLFSSASSCCHYPAGFCMTNGRLRNLLFSIPYDCASSAIIVWKPLVILTGRRKGAEHSLQMRTWPHAIL